MKKTIAVIGIASGLAVGAYAQGTIAFQDASGVSAKVYTDPNKTGLVGGNGVALAGTSPGFTVQLLFGVVGTPINSLTPGITFFSATGSGDFFKSGATALTGITAGNGSGDTTQNVEIAIQGWSGNFASEAAAIAGLGSAATFGITQEFTNPTGGGGSPAALQANLVNWTAANSLFLQPIGTVPEPSTIALGGVAGAALLAFRRRK